MYSTMQTTDQRSNDPLKVILANNAAKSSMTPLRLTTAIYFDLFIYWSVMFDNASNDLVLPKRGRIRKTCMVKYLKNWFLYLPHRTGIFCVTSFLIILNSLLMLGISIVLPTLTFYHGTRFKEAATKIVQEGKWYVGPGTFAGSGIYFAIKRRVAEHYASKDKNNAVIIVRITTTFTCNGKIMTKKHRDMIGKQGALLSTKLRFPWRTIEHWREHNNWWEYCIVQPGKERKYVNSWRVRPIAVINRDQPIRVWGGFHHYALKPTNFILGSLCWCSIVAAATSYPKIEQKFMILISSLS